MAKRSLTSKSTRVLLGGVLAGYLGLAGCDGRGSYFSSLDTNFNERNGSSSKTFNLESLLSDRNSEDRLVNFSVRSQTANTKHKKHPGYPVLEDALRVLPAIPKEYAKIRELANEGQFVFVDDIDQYFPKESAETRAEMKTHTTFALNLSPPLYIYAQSRFFSQLLTARKQLLTVDIGSSSFERASKMVSVNSYLFVAKLAHGYLHGWRRFEEVEALKAEIAIIEGLQKQGVFSKLGADVDAYLADLRSDLAEEQAKKQQVIPIRP